MNPVQKGILALIIANVIWGFASPIFKWSMGNIPPFTLAFLRFFLASIIMTVYLRGKIRLPRYDKKELLALLLYAQTGIVGNIIFFFFGLQLTLAMNAPVIASAAPIMIFLAAPFFLHEKLKTKKIIGMAVGTLGILAIVLEPIYYNGLDGNFLGNIFLVLATIAGAAGTLVGRKLFQEHDPINLMYWAFIIGAVTFAPFAAYEFGKDPTLYSSLNIQGITGIVFGAVFSSTIAYMCYGWGLSKIAASEASLFSYVDPIAGTVLAYFMLHEPITIPFIVGGALIFLGIYIAERRLHYHPLHRLWRKIENVVK